MELYESFKLELSCRIYSDHKNIAIWGSHYIQAPQNELSINLAPSIHPFVHPFTTPAAKTHKIVPVTLFSPLHNPSRLLHQHHLLPHHGVDSCVLGLGQLDPEVVVVGHGTFASRGQLSAEENILRGTYLLCLHWWITIHAFHFTINLLRLGSSVCSSLA